MSNDPSMAKTKSKDSRAFAPLLHTPDHPPYAEMVRAAITALHEKGGSSKEAISTYIESAYLDLPLGHVGLLAHHLIKLTKLGEINRSHDNHYSLPDFQQTTPDLRRKECPPNSSPRSEPQPLLLACKPLCAPVRRSPMQHSMMAAPENCTSQSFEYRGHLSKPRREPETSESDNLVKSPQHATVIHSDVRNDPWPKRGRGCPPKPRGRPVLEMSKAGDLVTFSEPTAFKDVGVSDNRLPQHRGRPPQNRPRPRTMSEQEAIPLAIRPPRPSMLLCAPVRRSSRLLHSEPAVPEPETFEARDLLMCPQPITLIKGGVSNDLLPKRRRGCPPKRPSCESE